MLNTVIIDDQNLFKEGFKLLLNTIHDYHFNVLEMDFKELLNGTSPEIHLIFVDLNQKRLDEMDQLSQLRSNQRKAKIAVLSVFNNTKVVRESFQSGIDAYFLKNISINDVKNGLDEIFNGKTYMTDGLRLTPKIGHKPNSEVRQNLYNNQTPLKQKLTKRESEVLAMIILAKSNKEIGDELYISAQTVGVHKKNIMRKLGVHNTVALIRYAIDHNLA